VVNINDVKMSAVPLNRSKKSVKMFINENTSELNRKYTLSLINIILINEKIILPVAHFIH